MSAYQENIESVKAALCRTGGMVLPWMRFTITETDLKRIIVDAEWIVPKAAITP